MAAGRGGRARVPARWGLGGGRGEDGGMERREKRGRVGSFIGGLA
jgi:hypothetical protein